MSHGCRVVPILLAVVVSVLTGCASRPASQRTAVQDASRYADPEALRELISAYSERYVLVDVRTAAEYDAGHIPTAINIPYDRIAETPPSADRKELIIVYCASGMRSAAAKRSLDALGYVRVVDFGSISRWKGAIDRSPLPGECPCRAGGSGS
jgi:phage shock protein E